MRDLPPGRYVVQMTHIHENNPIQGEYYDSEFYIVRVDTPVSLRLAWPPEASCGLTEAF